MNNELNASSSKLGGAVNASPEEGLHDQKALDRGRESSPSGGQPEHERSTEPRSATLFLNFGFLGPAPEISCSGASAREIAFAGKSPRKGQGAKRLEARLSVLLRAVDGFEKQTFSSFRGHSSGWRESNGTFQGSFADEMRGPCFLLKPLKDGWREEKKAVPLPLWTFEVHWRVELVGEQK